VLYVTLGDSQLGYGFLRNRTALATEESHDVAWHQRNPLVSPEALQVLLTEWRQRIRLRYEVERLTEQELADMRLTREDVVDEVQKPFWQR
jgi:uncharacterized protein YjiS (DUF1127 family)